MNEKQVKLTEFMIAFEKNPLLYNTNFCLCSEGYIYEEASWGICAKYSQTCISVKYAQVLELMQMHPKDRLSRVILTVSWFIAINVGQFVSENSLRFPWHILIFSWRDLVDLVDL